MATTRDCILALVVTTVLLTAQQGAAAEPTGWRADYTDATPPTQWSANANIRWKTPLPSVSRSHPIILDNRLYLCAEPDRLICIDLDDGKVLWTKRDSLNTVLGKDEMNRYMDVILELRGKVQERRSLRQQRDKLKKSMWFARHKEEKLAVMRPKLDKIMAKIAELDEALVPYDTIRPETSKDVGFSSPTPVTDGARVYAAFGSGVVVAYTPSGKRVWGKMAGPVRTPGGHRASPVLAGGHLILTMAAVIALDPATGEEVWRVKEPPHRGTPAVLPMAGGEQIVLPSGRRLAAKDGAELPGTVGACVDSPLPRGDKVYCFDETGASAWQVPAAADAEPTQLWKLKKHGFRNLEFAPALYKDVLCVVAGRGGLRGFAVADGKRVDGIAAGIRGHYACPPTVAGDLLFITTRGNRRSAGAVHVFKMNDKLNNIATNSTLGQIYAAPVFVGSRAYLVSGRTLWCIEEGAE